MAIRRTGTFPVAGSERRADALTAALGARPWQRLSAGAGAGRTAPANTTGPGSPSRPAAQPYSRPNGAAQDVSGRLSRTAVARMGCCTLLLYKATRSSKNTGKSV